MTTPRLGPQRRRRRIAMSSAERDAFLEAQKVCHMATIGADNIPHVTPLWFVWDGSELWLYSIIKSQRWVNLHHNPLASVVADAGEAYNELRGVELVGEVEFIGEEPRVGLPNPDLEEPERLFARKYAGSEAMGYDERHAWVRLRPEREVSWDFRKLAGSVDAFTAPAQADA